MPALLTSAIAVNQIQWIDSLYLTVTFDVLISSVEITDTKVKLDNLFSANGTQLNSYTFTEFFIVDTKKPMLASWSVNYPEVTDATVAQELSIQFDFNEACDMSLIPFIDFVSVDLVNPTLNLNSLTTGWTNDTTYVANYSVTDFDETVPVIVTKLANVNDIHFNEMDTVSTNMFMIDTENPLITSAVSSDALLTIADLSSPQFDVVISFNEAMNTTVLPSVNLSNQGVTVGTITQNMAQTNWVDPFNLSVQFLLFSDTNNLTSLDMICVNALDSRDNPIIDTIYSSLLDSDMKAPSVSFSTPNKSVISDSLVGTTFYIVDTQFDEPMDTTVNPLVKHEAIQSLTNTVQYDFIASQYLDLVTFRAYFQVLDEGIEIDLVNLKVEFAEDFSGNIQEVFIDSNFITIDTKNPSVIGLYANDYVLDQLNDPFNVVAVFDEAMLEDKGVSLSFSPLITLPVVLSFNDSSWINSTTYSFDYELIASPAQSTEYGINIHSGVDLAGNKVVALDVPDFVIIDQVVGINGLSDLEFQLYPTFLKSGEIVFIHNNKNVDASSIELELINPMGQLAQKLIFHGDGSKFTSEPIIQPAGMYYLRNGSTSHKLIILE